MAAAADSPGSSAACKLVGTAERLSSAWFQLTWRLGPSCCLQASQNEIREALESSDEDAKVAAMQKAITAILAGEQFPALFITIVRYVLPSENHMVQKLLLLYLVSGL